LNDGFILYWVRIGTVAVRFLFVFIVENKDDYHQMLL
jgi:hypothetical protein